MKRSFLLFVVGLWLIYPQVSYSEVRNPANGHYYRVVNNHSPEAVTWTSANAAAQTYSYLGVTGHLATITSQEEQEFVESLIAAPAPTLGSFWIGGMRVGNAWSWITGEPFMYTNPSPLQNPEAPGDYGLVMLNRWDYGLPGDLAAGQWFPWGINSVMAWYGGIGFIVEYETSGMEEPSCVAPPEGIVAWWPGDGNTEDIVGGNDGSLVGTATYASPALVGDGFRFLAQGDYIRVPSTSALEPAHHLTVEAWVRSVRPGAYKYILGKGADGGAGSSFALYTGNWETVMFYVRGAEPAALWADSAEFWNGDWHHVVGRYDEGNVVVFVDGVCVGGHGWGPASIDYDLPDRDLFIGGYGGMEGFSFPGEIDEVTIYNRALSADEIWYLYLNESIRRCKTCGGRILTNLNPVEVWIGLKNSDDVGTRFDLQAEIFLNDTAIGSGEIVDVPGGSSGFNRANLLAIPLTLNEDITINPEDRFSVRISVRVAAASPHRGATARLWFGDQDADSHFGAIIGDASSDFYLLGSNILGTSAGVGPKTSIDVKVDRAKDGNPYRAFGTWSEAP